MHKDIIRYQTQNPALASPKPRLPRRPPASPAPSAASRPNRSRRPCDAAATDRWRYAPGVPSPSQLPTACFGGACLGSRPQRDGVWSDSLNSGEGKHAFPGQVPAWRWCSSTLLGWVAESRCVSKRCHGGSAHAVTLPRRTTRRRGKSHLPRPRLLEEGSLQLKWVTYLGGPAP